MSDKPNTTPPVIPDIHKPPVAAPKVLLPVIPDAAKLSPGGRIVTSADQVPMPDAFKEAPPAPKPADE